MTDTERIDFLEAFAKREPLVLHDTNEVRGGYSGLGLLGGRRTLREAIDQCAGSPPVTGDANHRPKITKRPERSV